MASVQQVSFVNNRLSASDGVLSGLFNVPAVTDGMLWVITAGKGVGQHTSVTCGGQSLTFGFRFDNGGDWEYQVWYLMDADFPSTGSQGIYMDPSVAWMGGMYAVVHADVDQTTPFGSIVEDTNTDKSISFSGTGTSGNLIFGMCAGEDGWNSSLTETGDATTTDISAQVGDSTTDSTWMYLAHGASAGSYTESITYTGPSQAYAAVEVYETPPSAGGGVLGSAARAHYMMRNAA